MDAKKLYWSLYNLSTQRQIDGLTFTQARGFLDSLEPGQNDEWQAWHEGLSEWKPITHFTELDSKTQHQARQAPPHPPKVAHKITGHENFSPVLEYREDADDTPISLEDKGYTDNRLNRRFLQTYKVQVPYLGSVLSTETLDISLGGMSLKQDLPPQMTATFTATLIHTNGAVVKIPCTLILERDGNHRNRVKFHLTADNESIIRTWLLSAVEHQA